MFPSFMSMLWNYKVPHMVAAKSKYVWMKKNELYFLVIEEISYNLQSHTHLSLMKTSTKFNFIKIVSTFLLVPLTQAFCCIPPLTSNSFYKSVFILLFPFSIAKNYYLVNSAGLIQILLCQIVPLQSRRIYTHVCTHTLLLPL